MFYQGNGLKLAIEPFEVKGATLFNWQKEYKESGIEGLRNGDRSLRRKRQSQKRQEIKEYRTKYKKIHQNEIKPHLDEYCKKKK